MAYIDFLFMIQPSGVQKVNLDKEVKFFEGLPEKLALEGVKTIYAEKVDSPVEGVVAIVRFDDELTKAQSPAEPNEHRIETFCHAVRDHVADDINQIIFDNGTVRTNGNGKVVTKINPHIGLGFAHLTKWAHASMANVIAGLDLGSYYGINGTYDPDSDKNSYIIGNLEGGSGGKH